MWKIPIALIVLLPTVLLVWDVVDALFFPDTRTEREVMGPNFLEHGRYGEAIEDLVDTHGPSAPVLVVHVDIRSAQITVVTGARTATVEGFGERGGGEANVAGGPVEDYVRRIGEDERPTGVLGSLVREAPRTIVSSLDSQGVDIDDVISLRLMDHRWSILVATGPDPGDTERWTARPDGSSVTPQE
jgi:hypothetical protein